MKLTPAMQQYMDFKEQHPDAILLFRMGDFYETFFDDAIAVSKILNITLTKRNNGGSEAALAGFPYHALDKYIGKLVQTGNKVAICEQIEDPKQAKGVVKRDIVRIITPGTITDQHLLDDKRNNYIMAIAEDDGNFFTAVCDVSTGQFLYGSIANAGIVDEIGRFQPAELVIPTGITYPAIEEYAQRNGVYVAHVPTHHFFKQTDEIIRKQFTHLPDDEQEQGAIAALLRYLTENQRGNLAGIRTLQHFSQQSFMTVDASTLRNLELLRNIRDQTAQDTLLSVLDRTCTPMGGRLIKEWIVRPLCNPEEITQRLDAVSTLIKDAAALTTLSDQLSEVRDIERLAAKSGYGSANARDLRSLASSIGHIPAISTTLEQQKEKSRYLGVLAKMPDVTEIARRIIETIIDDPPATLRDGGIIRKGVDEELDDLLSIRADTRSIIAKLEREEMERTGISTLKIKYNRTFGYFIEISNRFKEQVPDHYIRKQTLTTGERFITDELKRHEEKILGAEDKIKALEYDIFQRLLTTVQEHLDDLLQIAQQIARADVIHAFAIAAKEQRYCRPEVDCSEICRLESCRHPVVERIEKSFVPNDCVLNRERRFMIITGPNMAGKSTYMRQVALCVLMAQCGSYVPAKKAHVGIVDRIFTRVGAHDDLSQGQSTFMVEMLETATILKEATSKSLIILDEIGRGTSTYDGTALAWAVAEDIIDRIQAKALFATHYHVLTQLDEKAGAFNVNVAVDEREDTITFLHSIEEGGTDKSYGVHVARLAGLPIHVIEAAQKIQFKLEDEDDVKRKITVETKVAHHEGKIERTLHKIKQKNLEEF